MKIWIKKQKWQKQVLNQCRSLFSNMVMVLCLLRSAFGVDFMKWLLLYFMVLLVLLVMLVMVLLVCAEFMEWCNFIFPAFLLSRLRKVRPDASSSGRMVIIIHNYDLEVKIMISRRMMTNIIFWNDDKDNDNASCSDGDGNVENVRHQMSDVR